MRKNVITQMLMALVCSLYSEDRTSDEIGNSILKSLINEQPIEYAYCWIPSRKMLLEFKKINNADNSKKMKLEERTKKLNEKILESYNELLKIKNAKQFDFLSSKVVSCKQIDVITKQYGDKLELTFCRTIEIEVEDINNNKLVISQPNGIYVDNVWYHTEVTRQITLNGKVMYKNDAPVFLPSNKPIDKDRPEMSP